jgi:hypothetical protein
MCLCHGGSAYGSIVSIRSITPSWASANFVNGDKYLRVSLTLSVASGCAANPAGVAAKTRIIYKRSRLALLIGVFGAVVYIAQECWVKRYFEGANNTPRRSRTQVGKMPSLPTET